MSLSQDDLERIRSIIDDGIKPIKQKLDKIDSDLLDVVKKIEKAEKSIDVMSANQSNILASTLKSKNQQQKVRDTSPFMSSETKNMHWLDQS